MGHVMRKLVTIITETTIESVLTRDLERLGASGYTITDARGRGHRGVRNSSWEPSSNIRIEVVCNSDIAEVITAHLQEYYYDNYAMIVYVSDVVVMRPEKF